MENLRSLNGGNRDLPAEEHWRRDGGLMMKPSGAAGK